MKSVIVLLMSMTMALAMPQVDISSQAKSLVRGLDTLAQMADVLMSSGVRSDLIADAVSVPDGRRELLDNIDVSRLLDRDDMGMKDVDKLRMMDRDKMGMMDKDKMGMMDKDKMEVMELKMPIPCKCKFTVVKGGDYNKQVMVLMPKDCEILDKETLAMLIKKPMMMMEKPSMMEMSMMMEKPMRLRAGILDQRPELETLRSTIKQDDLASLLRAGLRAADNKKPLMDVLRRSSLSDLSNVELKDELARRMIQQDPAALLRMSVMDRMPLGRQIKEDRVPKENINMEERMPMTKV